MEIFYLVVFGVLALATLAVELTRGVESSKSTGSVTFQAFRTNYLFVYSLMMGEQFVHAVA